MGGHVPDSQRTTFVWKRMRYLSSSLSKLFISVLVYIINVK